MLCLILFSQKKNALKTSLKSPTTPCAYQATLHGARTLRWGPVEGSVLTLFWGVFTGGQVDWRPPVLQNNNPLNPSYLCSIHGTSNLLAQPTVMPTKAWMATDVISGGLQYSQRLCKRSLHGTGWSYSYCRQEVLSKSQPVGRTWGDEDTSRCSKMKVDVSYCISLVLWMKCISESPHYITRYRMFQLLYTVFLALIIFIYQHTDT